MACARLQERLPLRVDVIVPGLSMRGRNGLGLPRRAVVVVVAVAVAVEMAVEVEMEVVHGRLGGESREAIAARLHLRGKTGRTGRPWSAIS